MVGTMNARQREAFGDIAPAVAAWLNKHGYQTRKGCQFGVGPLHKVLTNPIYVGRGPYSVSSSNGGKHPKDEVIEFQVPAIIEQSHFEAVHQRLPKGYAATRRDRSLVLLTALATCEQCGGGMTMSTGPSKSGRVYTYYACANRAQKGASVCKGNRIAMTHLDSIILNAAEAQAAPVSQVSPERVETFSVPSRKSCGTATLCCGAITSGVLSEELSLGRIGQLLWAAPMASTARSRRAISQQTVFAVLYKNGAP